MMKRRLVFILIACSVMSGSVFAVPTVQLYQDKDNFSYGNGGEFKALTSVDFSGNYVDGVTSLSPPTGTFQTFCIEYSEHFSPGVEYDYVLNDRAVYGSEGPGGDIISKGTAWLYYNFAKGTLLNYEYSLGTDRVNAAGELQLALWVLEDESSVPSSWGDSSWWGVSSGAYNNQFLEMVSQEFDSGSGLINAKSDYGGSTVRVMNLYKKGYAGNADYRKQDQLVIVPAPGAILLGSIGIGLVGWLRRRRTL